MSVPSSAARHQALEAPADVRPAPWCARGGRVLRSCDVTVARYFGEARATGAAVQTMSPHPRTLDAWPFEKTAGGLDRNVGVVRLPDDLTRLLPLAEALLDRAWEHAPTRWHVSLPEPFAVLHATLDDRLAGVDGAR